MIAFMRVNLAAEDPIGIGGVGEDQRHEYQDSNKQEAKAFVGSGRIPDRKGGWNDVGIEADAKPNKTQDEQAER